MSKRGALWGVLVLGLQACGGGGASMSASAPPASPAPAEAEPPEASAPAETTSAPAETSPAASQPLSREQVAGDWSTSGTDYESLSLRPDGSADSYLHDRPFDQGQWRLAGTTLEIGWAANGVEKVTVLGRNGADLKVRTEAGPMVWHAIETR